MFDILSSLFLAVFAATGVTLIYDHVATGKIPFWPDGPIMAQRKKNDD